MDVKFGVNEQVQIVQIAGNLLPAEATAVKAKIDERITQGFRRYVFSIEKLNLNDQTTLTSFGSLISYCRNRENILCCAGLSSEHWDKLRYDDGKSIKSFVTREEAYDFVNKELLAEEKKMAPALPPKTGEPNAEEEKKNAVAKLVAQYERYFQVSELDPYRLEFFAQKYKEKPDASLLRQERKAEAGLKSLTAEIADIKAECDDLAIKVKLLLLSRKTPNTAVEITNKLHALEGQMDHLKKENEALAKLLKDKMVQNELGRRAISAMDVQLENELKELDDKQEHEKKENERILAELEATDKKETEELKVKLEAAKKSQPPPAAPAAPAAPPAAPAAPGAPPAPATPTKA